jgi:arylsulfatase A-like enzyme
MPIKKWLYDGGPDPELVDRDVQHLRDLYDGEIQAIDHNLRRLIDGFRRLRLFDQTLFVIVSDHGESFMDHRHIAHGTSMYQPVLREAVRTWREQLATIGAAPAFTLQPEAEQALHSLGYIE